MKTVWFIRHAKSSWDYPELRDFYRPLNHRGQRDAPVMARFLHEKGLHPDLLLSSPAVRALQTARYFAAAFDIPDIREEPRIYEATPSMVLSVIQELEDTWQMVFVFGHNPAFHELANGFAGEALPNVPTCGIFRVDAEVAHWRDFSCATGRRTVFFYPKQFQL